MGHVEFKPYAESVELIEKGQLDATLQSAGLGMAAIRDLAERVPITFVAIPEQVVSRIGSSAYQSGTIPAGTYKGQANDVMTATITNVLVSQTSVSDAVAYQMTKLLFENLDRLAEAHPAARDIRLERATSGLPIPLHPGAERFYREVGVLK